MPQFHPGHSRLDRYLIIPSIAGLFLPLTSGIKYSTACRVSSKQQGKRGSLDGQEANQKKLIGETGSKADHRWRIEWSGRGPQWIGKLKDYGKRARDNGAEAASFATLDRFIRSFDFLHNHPILWAAMPTKSQVEDALEAIAMPVTIINGPESSAVSNRSLLTAWAPDVGRPKTKREGDTKKRKDKLLREVIRLRGFLSMRIVSILTGIPVPTIQLWERI